MNKLFAVFIFSCCTKLGTGMPELMGGGGVWRWTQHGPIHTVLVQDTGLASTSVPSTDFLNYWFPSSFSKLFEACVHKALSTAESQPPLRFKCSWKMLMLKRATDHRGKMSGQQNQPGLILISKGRISSDFGGREAKRLYISQNQIAKCFEVFVPSHEYKK